MKKIKTLFALAIFALFTVNAFGASVDLIQPIDSRNLDVTVSSDVVFSDLAVYGDVKVLKSLDIMSVESDTTNARRITLRLLNPLEANSNYSIISVGQAEGSIEFALGYDVFGEFNNFSIPGMNNIERILVQDAFTIDVYYNYDVVGDDFNFEVLRELKVESLSSAGNNVLNVSLFDPLERAGAYILIVSDLMDTYGMPIVFDEPLYDFYTNSDLADFVEYGVDSNLVNEDLNSGDVDGNVEEVASGAQQTPQTGPQAWIILALALLMTAVVFVKNKVA